MLCVIFVQFFMFSSSDRTSVPGSSSNTTKLGKQLTTTTSDTKVSKNNSNKYQKNKKKISKNFFLSKYVQFLYSFDIGVVHTHTYH